MIERCVATTGTSDLRSAQRIDAVVAGGGIEVVKIPPGCPRANCYAEILIGTIRRQSPTHIRKPSLGGLINEYKPQRHKS